MLSLCLQCLGHASSPHSTSVSKRRARLREVLLFDLLRIYASRIGPTNSEVQCSFQEQDILWNCRLFTRQSLPEHRAVLNVGESELLSDRFQPLLRYLSSLAYPGKQSLWHKTRTWMKNPQACYSSRSWLSIAVYSHSLAHNMSRSE